MPDIRSVESRAFVDFMCNASSCFSDIVNKEKVTICIGLLCTFGIVCHLTKLSLNLSEMNPGVRQAILKPYVMLKMLLKYSFN